ncbi:histone-like nucleoid-structuring protein Lsr2 [Streptomyces sp. MP131-18]|uniref:Lsr2 family DNA-binding protein n=1 Tax=Streptomyces sp. MP131-18 TaxID=1857892 RepID=UPI00097BF02C|nr:histone-like nucleoid-structuring protein Lsr2 [Streptomyces sp. MP131-18]ONK09285.1 Lsr2 [Streptomyces sp. MP131-18]
MTDPRTRAAVIDMLKAHAPVETVADTTGLSTGEIAAIAHDAGLTREHAREATRSLLDALAWGERHDSKKIRSLAARARTALDDLVHQRRTEAEVTATQTEIAKLRKQLAAAETKLRQAKGKPATGATRPHGRSEREQIRQWARANGHTVHDRGALPTKVLAAYRRAHGTADTAGRPVKGRPAT